MVAHPAGVHRIQPSGWLVPVDFGELWRYRELVRFFVLRDAKIRYRQTHLGPAWAIIKPLLTIVVFSAIFGGLAKISPGAGVNVPYALWVTPGVLAFGYVSTTLTNLSTSLVLNRQIITKVYFPRVYVPITTALTPIIDFVVGLLVLLGLFAYFDQTPSWHIVFLPAFLALCVLVTMGVGLWLCAFTARYRDWAIGVTFLVQIWQYATPVIYPVHLIPKPYRLALELNPYTGVVTGFRWCLLGLPLWPGAVAASLGIGAAATITGLFFFRRTERFMVDLL